MGISGLLSYPYFTGSSSGTTTVPGAFDVAINGRGYFLDTKHQAFGQGLQTIQVLRNQADTADSTGEQSLNPEGLWRRSVKSWHHGAGQTYWDRNNSDPYRFRSSKGIDPWTSWNLKAHLATGVGKSLGSGSTVMMAVAGEFLYMSSGSALEWSGAVATPLSTTSVTGLPATAISSITSDGYHVWTAHGVDGIYLTTRGSPATASTITGTVDQVAYAKGRLLATYESALYNPTAPGALPTALYTHTNTDWRWTGFAEGPAFIYMAGYSGDKSFIYKTAIKPDGTALDIPVVAGELPRSEIIRTIHGVSGVGLLIGTDDGVRFAAFDANGNLSMQPLIDIDTPVYSFATWRNFAYFGWGPYDSDNSGIGRLDLSTFNTDVPAYASDLMDDGAISNGVTTSVVIFGGTPVFGITDGSTTNKVYLPGSNYVASGSLDSGLITYDISDSKLAMYMDIRHDALPTGTSIRMDIAADDSDFDSVGLSNIVSSTGLSPITIGELAGERFEVRTVISSGTTTTPVVSRETLRSFPTPSRAKTVLVPLLIHERMNYMGADYYYTPLDEFNYFDDLVLNRRLSTYQELSVPLAVFVEDYQMERGKATKDRSWWNHTLVLKLKVLPN